MWFGEVILQQLCTLVYKVYTKDSVQLNAFTVQPSVYPLATLPVPAVQEYWFDLPKVQIL